MSHRVYLVSVFEKFLGGVIATAVINYDYLEYFCMSDSIHSELPILINLEALYVGITTTDIRPPIMYPLVSWRCRSSTVRESNFEWKKN